MSSSLRVTIVPWRLHLDDRSRIARVRHRHVIDGQVPERGIGGLRNRERQRLIAQQQQARRQSSHRGLNVLDPLDHDRAGGATLHRHRRNPVDMRVVPIEARRLVGRDLDLVAEALARIDQCANDFVAMAPGRRIYAVKMHVDGGGCHGTAAALRNFIRNDF